MVTHQGLSTNLEIKPTLYIQHNKRYHMKGQLNSFHLNGHTLGFHPHT